ncbi:hypothetical protein ACB092_03G062600 [Castanea dentata]
MVFGFGANLSFWVWSRSNSIISASSNPTKPFHNTNPNSTKTMTSNPTVFASSATPSNNVILTNDYLLVVVILINREFGLVTSFSLTQAKFVFPVKSIVPIVLSASREKHNLLALICLPLLCL